MKNKSKILPVLFGFFIMGFCDLVGVSVTYAKDYFSWSEPSRFPAINGICMVFTHLYPDFYLDGQERIEKQYH